MALRTAIPRVMERLQERIGGILTGLVIPESNSSCGLVPVINFQASDSVICANDCINFINMCTNSISYQWLSPVACLRRILLQTLRISAI